jgi:hypothetical protein
MTKSDTINELAAALAQAQGEIRNATKDASNPFFKSNYADLASVREAIQPVFTKHGLSYAQTFSRDDHGVIVETILMHKSGQWLCGGLSIKPVKDDPQGIGSAITYARRYSLQAVAGIAADDDDGEAAMGRDTKRSEHARDTEGSVRIAEKLASGKVNTTPPATKPTSTPTAHPSVTALKPGEKCTIQRILAEYHTAAKGKPLGRVVFQDDPTKYGVAPNQMVGQPGDEVTIEVAAHESTDGKVWYEATSIAPF